MLTNTEPSNSLKGLFSATQTQQLEELMKAGLRNPRKVVVNVERKQKTETPQEHGHVPLQLETQNVPSSYVGWMTR